MRTWVCGNYHWHLRHRVRLAKRYHGVPAEREDKRVHVSHCPVQCCVIGIELQVSFDAGKMVADVFQHLRDAVEIGAEAARGLHPSVPVNQYRPRGVRTINIIRMPAQSGASTSGYVPARTSSAWPYSSIAATRGPSLLAMRRWVVPWLTVSADWAAARTWLMKSPAWMVASKISF